MSCFYLYQLTVLLIILYFLSLFNLFSLSDKDEFLCFIWLFVGFCFCLLSQQLCLTPDVFSAAWLREHFSSVIFLAVFSAQNVPLKKYLHNSIYITICNPHAFISMLPALCASPTVVVWRGACLSGKCQLWAGFSCYSAIIHCQYLFLFSIVCESKIS